MAKQWVDITTIDNVTPFTKVRWKSVMTFAGGDTWLAEAPGLDTTGMFWLDGNTAALGYFGGHRMNNSAWGNAYTCSMNCEQYGIDQSTIAYRVAVKDESRGQAGFYDSAVTISGETYYEVDFSLWENASGKSLYMPYAVAPWAPGDILVEIESGPIKLDKDSMSFKATGGSQTVTVTADDDWTASASSAWITVSALSGASGTSVVTISTPNYTDITTGRTGSVTFTCSGDTAVLSVSQRKASSGGFGGIFIGAVAAEAMYIGNTEVSAMYIGENLVFPTETNTVIRYIAPAKVVPNVAYSDSAWTLTLVSDTYDSASSAGTVTFSGTGLTIPDGAFSATTISEVTIGKGVTTIGEYAFNGCADLTTLSIPKTVTSIGDGAFWHCTSLGEIVIPNTVTSVGDFLFFESTSLSAATLPAGETEIKDGTFQGCSALTSFDIPSGVTSIGSSAFRGTTSLTTLTIPAGVTNLGSSSFMGSGIIELTFEGNTPPATVGSFAFNNVSPTGTIYCPGAAVSTYTTWAQTYGLSGWTVYGPLEPLTLTFTSAGSIGWNSTIRGTNWKLKYTLNGSDWSAATSTTTNRMSVQAGDVIQLRAGINPTSDIAYNANPMRTEGTFTVRGSFMSLAGPDWESATTLTHKVAPLFKGSTGLTDASGLIMPPMTLTDQHKAMFSGCTSLSAAPQLPATTLSQGCYAYMFADCTSLQTAPTLPAAVVSQEGYSGMFSGCTALTSITCMATDRTATSSTAGWVTGVGSTGTFTKAAGYTEWSTGDNGIPSGWTVIDV